MPSPRPSSPITKYARARRLRATASRFEPGLGCGAGLQPCIAASVGQGFSRAWKVSASAQQSERFSPTSRHVAVAHRTAIPSPAQSCRSVEARGRLRVRQSRRGPYWEVVRGSNPCLPANFARSGNSLARWLLGTALGFDRLAQLAALGTNPCLPATPQPSTISQRVQSHPFTFSRRCTR